MRKSILLFLLSLLCIFDSAFQKSSLKFTVPTGWIEEERTSSMRVAQYKLTRAEGDTENGSVVLYYFGQGQGGGTQANVDRWLGQFEEPKDKINSKVEEKKVGSSKITYVEAEGTYKSGMPGAAPTPKPGTKLLGAILESPNGNVFARMTGPIATVKAADADFRKMIESAFK